MKKKDVIITMRTVQNCDELDEDNTLDFVTDGSYTYDNNVGCVTYEESEVTGMPGTTTSVFIMPDQVVVDRDGSLTSRMVFKEGEKTSFLYEMPYGSTTLGLDTRKIVQNFNDGGGTAEVEYVIDFARSPVSRNRLTIDVRQTGGLNQCVI